MAMNKAEKARLEGAEQALREAKALRHTQPVAHDVPVPGWGETVNGWGFNLYSAEVRKTCSSGHGHSWGKWDKTDSQGSIRQYSTPLLALQAMRFAIFRYTKYDEFLESL